VPVAVAATVAVSDPVRNPESGVWSPVSGVRGPVSGCFVAAKGIRSQSRTRSRSPAPMPRVRVHPMFMP